MGLFSEDLFPTKLSMFIFLAYMALFINQGLLVTASKDKNKPYSYNTVTVVLFTEIIKLVAAVILYWKDNSLSQFIKEFYENRKVCMYYFVPAALYCLYNNLQFVNLAAYDPTTYYLLLQFRVVVTGVIFQIVFSKHLSRMQWLSLIFLTVGCIIKEVSFDSKNADSKAPASTVKDILSYLDPHLLLIMVQVFCSCFAGVYNEFLLKDKGVNIHIMLQNAFMYIDSIICNLLILTYKGEIIDAFRPSSITSIFQFIVIAIMLNNAAIGICVSFFLRSLNSILKTFASALELMFTAVLCWLIFGIPIDIYTIIAVFIVSAASILYSQNPVVNLPKVTLPKTTSDTI